MSKITVEIVDDNEINVAMLRNIVSAQEEFEVIGTAFDGETAITDIMEKEPDVVLLDIVMPGIDGIAVLERIRASKDLKKQPKILMVTAIGRDDITCEAFQKGADYYIMKPFIAAELVKNIKSVCTSLGHGAKENQVVQQKMKEELEQEESSLQIVLESDIMKIFSRLGISSIAGGYPYLKEAVMLAVNEPKVLNRVTKGLYPVIAEKFGATKDNVERQIRRAIEIGWGRADLNAINEYFGYTVDERKGKPTNSEFIAQIADFIRLDYMKQGRKVGV